MSVPEPVGHAEFMAATVNPALTRKRATSGPTHRDSDDLAAGIARQLRALAKRLAEQDADSLALVRDLQRELDAVWGVAVAGMRRSGHTDREIGLALGVSKQAVHQRWPRQPDPKGPR